MERGKKICKTLKEVRMQVAKANDIEYAPAECHHEGDCPGTCPKCEAELKYIERQLSLRRQLGKAIAVVGVSVGLAAVTACTTKKPNPKEDLLEGMVPNTTVTDIDTIEQLEGDVPYNEGFDTIEVPQPEEKQKPAGEQHQ